MKMIRFCSLKLLALSIVLWMTSATMRADDKNIKKNSHPSTRQFLLCPLLLMRGGAMGDNGVSTLPDANSQYWNPAKYAFSTSSAGVSLSYTPWLRKLVNDVALVNLSGFYKIGSDDRQAIAASLRYFTFGEINDYDSNSGALLTTINPYEMAFDVSYSRKLSESYSMAVGLRYIRSDQGADADAEMVRQMPLLPTWLAIWKSMSC